MHMMNEIRVGLGAAVAGAAMVLSGCAHEAGHSEVDDVQDLGETLYTKIIANDVAGIVEVFDGTPKIDAPRTGAFVGHDQFAAFVANESAWLASLGVVPESLQQKSFLRSDGRAVFEQTLNLSNAPSHHMNLVTVVDLEGDKASAIRVYYRVAEITRKKSLHRTQILPEDPRAIESLHPTVVQYTQEIKAANLDVYQMFSADGCAEAFCGDGVGKFFSIAMEAGSVPLELVSSTCSDDKCAIEWNLASWGDSVFEAAAAGVAVFEMRQEGGLQALRIYDDIIGAPFHEPGWFADNWDQLAQNFQHVGCPLKEAPPANAPAMKAMMFIMAQSCDR